MYMYVWVFFVCLHFMFTCFLLCKNIYLKDKCDLCIFHIHLNRLIIVCLKYSKKRVIGQFVITWLHQLVPRPPPPHLAWTGPLPFFFHPVDHLLSKLNKQILTCTCIMFLHHRSQFESLYPNFIFPLKIHV